MNDTKKKESDIFKFMSIDGAVFHLRCRTVFEAVFDSSLFGFMTLCITIFTAMNLMMFALRVPGEEVRHWTWQVFGIPTFLVYVLFFVIILAVLLVFGRLFFCLVKWGQMKTIYVPLFYILPTALYGLGAGLQGYDVITPKSVTITVMFLLICACFDILYARAGAPYHSKYIQIKDLAAVSVGLKNKADPLTELDGKPISPNLIPNQKSRSSHPEMLASEPPTTAEHSSINKAERRALSPPAPRERITIGKKSFFCDEIRWIQSEDHYLKVHLASESVLLLGKLSDAVAQLSQQQGVQINRSIWVAHNAIQSIDTPNSRKMFVTLTDGQTLKVTPMGRKLLEKANKERAVE